MNRKKMQFLAIIAVIAFAFAAFAVVMNVDDSAADVATDADYKSPGASGFDTYSMTGTVTDLATTAEKSKFVVVSGEVTVSGTSGTVAPTIYVLDGAKLTITITASTWAKVTIVQATANANKEIAAGDFNAEFTAAAELVIDTNTMISINNVDVKYTQLSGTATVSSMQLKNTMKVAIGADATITNAGTIALASGVSFFMNGGTLESAGTEVVGKITVAASPVAGVISMRQGTIQYQEITMAGTTAGSNQPIVMAMHSTSDAITFDHNVVKMTDRAIHIYTVAGTSAGVLTISDNTFQSVQGAKAAKASIQVGNIGEAMQDGLTVKIINNDFSAVTYENGKLPVRNLADGVVIGKVGTEGINLALGSDDQSEEKLSSILLSQNSDVTIKGTISLKDVFVAGHILTVDGALTITGSVENSGTVKLKTYTLTDMTSIVGPMTFDGTSTVTASSGSKIVWDTKSLTAGTESEFTVDLTTMSPTITAGIVTLDKADIYEGQTVTVDDGAALVITGAMTLQSGAKIVNSGTVKVGAYTLTDMTQIDGQMSFDGDKVIAAASGSVITWGTNRTLTAYEDGAFSVDLSTMSPTITAGTVTLDESNIYAGQTVTVNSGATFVVTGAMTIQSGASIINNGTVKVSTYTLTDMTKIEGEMSFDGTKTITAASGSKITWGAKSLAATSGTFEVALDVMNPVIKTGTVTMDKATVYTGQTVTVNSGAIFVITGATTLESKTATITNNGTVKVGSYTLTDMTEIKGPMTYDGSSTITASAESQIEWGGERSLVAGTNGAFTVAVATLSPTITAGTVTLTASDIYPGQTVTVNADATLALAGAITIHEGAALVNNGTVSNGATLNNLGSITNGGTFTIATGGSLKCDTIVFSSLSGVTGAISLDGEGTIDASAGSKITWTTGYMEAKESSAWKAVWNSTNSGYDITVSKGTVEMTAPIYADWTLTVNSAAVLSIPANKTLTVSGKVINNGTIDLNGILDTSDCTGDIGTKGVSGTGVLNVFDGAEFKMAAATPIATIPTGQFLGTMKVFTGGKLAGITSGDNPLITLTGEKSYLQVVSKSTKTVRDVEYSLFGNGSVDDYTVYGGTFFAAGDKLVVAYGATLDVTALTINAGVKLTINGTVSVPDELVIKDSGLILVASGGSLIGAGTIDFSEATSNAKVMEVTMGGMLTVTLDGGMTENNAPSTVILTKVYAGAGGITVVKGSVIINGVIVAPGADGKVYVPANNTVYISGTVDAGVTLEIPSSSTVIVSAGSTLEIASGATLVNTGTVDVNATGSALIYDEGSVVNGEYTDVTTKVTKDGVQVAIVIYLLSQNDDKLEIDTPFVMAFSDATYGEILSMVNVEPQKSYVVFDGWYNTAMNEKITMGTKVLPYDHSITAKFTEEKRVPVPSGDDTTPSQTVVIDGTSSSGMTDFALPIAIVCLICSVLALGFIVMRRR